MNMCHIISRSFGYNKYIFVNCAITEILGHSAVKPKGKHTNLKG